MHEIELIIVKLINEAMTKAVTIEQMIDLLEIFVDFQQRAVWLAFIMTTPSSRGFTPLQKN